MIEVGEYIRTKDGYIGKAIENIGKNGKNENVYELRNVKVCGSLQNILVSEAYIKAHSKNIIDLIEEGDYVNGNLVLDIDVEDETICLLMPFNEENLSYFNVVWHTKNFIKTIVTKEQFNSVMYKVVE